MKREMPFLSNAFGTEQQAPSPVSFCRKSLKTVSFQMSVLIIFVLSVLYSSPATAQTITVNATPNALTNIPIYPHDYGANNIWYWVPDGDFYSNNGNTQRYASSLMNNAGINYFRFPGGFESEHYEWTDGPSPAGLTWHANTLDTSYSNYTPTQGVSPQHVTNNIGAGNVSFVVRTEDALTAFVIDHKPSDITPWAQLAGNLVTQYCPAGGGGVTDWQIGNEWYNSGASAGMNGNNYPNYIPFLQAYAQIIFYYAQSMQAAATAAHCSIKIYITSNWASPISNDGDMSQLQSEVGKIPAGTGTWSASGKTVWANEINGADIHLYTGVNPCQTKKYPPPPISHIQTVLGNVVRDSKLALIYVSEWAADLGDNDPTDSTCTDSEGYAGLQNANVMMQIFGQMAQGGLTSAAYWAPVYENIDTGCNSPVQANTFSLVSNTTTYQTSVNNGVTTCIDQSTTPPYTVNANGSAMQLLAGTYLGTSLATTSTQTKTQAIASLNSNGDIVVILMTNGAPVGEVDTVQITGNSTWTNVLSAQVIYANTASKPSQSYTLGPVTTAPLSVSLFQVNPGVSVQVPLTLGSTYGPWEIIQLTLGKPM